MNNSIGVACNFYQEANMLPGFLESASRFFDDIVMVAAGPSAAPRDEESLAICERWGVRVIQSSIDEGYGVLRTRCLRESSTEWVMIMDADERFFPWIPRFALHGEGRYPDQPDPGLSVGIAEPSYNQGDLLRDMVNNASNVDAIRFVRRHWMNFAMTRPAQRWDRFEDWQLRFLRNRGYIGYDSSIKMHERCVDSRTGADPSYTTASVERGPFVDHFHVPAKLMEPEQRQRDVRIYDAIHYGTQEKTWKELYG